MVNYTVCDCCLVFASSFDKCFDSTTFFFSSGDYITGDISDEYLGHLHAMRNDTTLTMNSMRMLSVSSR